MKTSIDQKIFLDTITELKKVVIKKSKSTKESIMLPSKYLSKRVLEKGSTIDLEMRSLDKVMESEYLVFELSDVKVGYTDGNKIKIFYSSDEPNEDIEKFIKEQKKTNRTNFGDGYYLELKEN
jgi:hypothetical protein